MESEFLLEVGTEEIPSGYLPDALRQLRELAERYLDQNRIQIAGKIATYGTPRRLVLAIEGLALKQTSIETEILGPPESVAFDTEGRPTKAYRAFLEKYNASHEDLKTKETNKGRYLVLRKAQEGRATKEVLSEIVPQMLSAISWPKSMRWGHIKTHFVRPVHWLLCLFNNDLIAFEFAGVRSGDTTYGHRFMSPWPIKVSGIRDYLERLEGAWVMVDGGKRAESIRLQISSILKGTGMEAILEDELLDTVTNLIEWPFVIRGGFEERFLRMPEEVLITVMKTHQKYFPVIKQDKRLAPYFIAVNNTKVKDEKEAIRGNERVLRARFQDAEFFYEEDLKVPLAKRLEGLRGVIFHVSLGSFYEKVMRFTKTAKFVAQRIRPGIEGDVELVCRLAKCDLLTHMVFEFPELQGVIGRHYAEKEGYPKEICEAIEQHYWPLKANDPISKSDVANCVGIADRIDNIVGFFAINQIPTGNADPFALRRHALAILRIVEEMEYEIEIKELINFQIEIYSASLSFDKDKLFEKVYEFFRERLRYKLIRSGYNQDSIEAVIGYDIDLISKISKKLQVLDENLENKVLADVIYAFKRVNNIIKAQKEYSDEFHLLTKPSELELISALNDIRNEVGEALAKDKYTEALTSLARMRPHIDRLFEEVEIMSNDKDLRSQRLGLLVQVRDVFLRWADFSKLNI